MKLLSSKLLFCPLSLSFITVFLTFFLSCIGANPPKNATFPALMIFGDSIFDTGNNNYIKTIAKANFPPYGKDFIGRIPTGRFSNGKLASDLIAEELGIKPLSPPFLDPSLHDEDLLTGANVASAASGNDPLTADLTSVMSLSDQLELFKEYITKLKKIAGEEKTSYILSESLYGVTIGNDDFIITYFNTPLRKFEYDVPSYADLLVSHSSIFVQDLYRLGARKIAVFGLPPIGCLPISRTLRGGLKRKCVDEFNFAAKIFNEKLSATIASLNTQFHDATIVYIDSYTPTLDIIENPQKFGFGIVDRGCCGTGIFEVAFLCQYACSNVDDYIYWDSVHPTEKTYRILVRWTIENYIDYFICGKSSC